MLKEYHLLDLLEISCAVNDRDVVYFRFRTDKAQPSAAETAAAEASGVPGTVGTQLVTIRDTRTNLLVKNVRESLRRMTCGVHPYFDVKVIIPPDQYVFPPCSHAQCQHHMVDTHTHMPLLGIPSGLEARKP